MLLLLFQLWETCCLLQLPHLHPLLTLIHFTSDSLLATFAFAKDAELSILKCTDGSVPAPPFDLCVARAERHSFGMPLGFLEHLRKSNLHCEDKLVVLTTEWLPWLQTNWRDSGR